MNERYTKKVDFEPQELARLARLRYVSDADPGYTRRRNGHGFVYFGVRSSRLSNSEIIERIERLAIPPAWSDVWVCRFATGHLQATGLDERRRKQYLYHSRWRDVANLAKFVRLERFGCLLPKLRRTVSRHLRGRKLSRNRVLAGAIALLDATSIRIGNEEYVRENNSYGLTTLRTRHVNFQTHRALLRFCGKGGARRDAAVEDPRLLRLLRQLTKLPGAHVFQYVDDEQRIRPITASEVNSYLREITGQSVTAKDFRTWKASATAAGHLLQAGEKPSVRERRRVLRACLAAGAEQLGNTVTVCRKYYVHPGLLDCYERGQFRRLARTFAPRRRRNFDCEEQFLAHFLGHWRVTKKLA